MSSKLNCWEFKKCGREPGGCNTSHQGICPAATCDRTDGINGGTNAGRICWSVAGTLCGTQVTGDCVSRETSCLDCTFYFLVREEEGNAFAAITEKMLRTMRMAAIGEAITGAAHSVKNMINGLQGGLFIAKKEFSEVGIATHESDGLAMLDRNMGRLMDFAMDMLFISKERAPVFENVDINELVHSVVSLLEADAKNDVTVLTFHPCKDVTTAMLDGNGIYRCILNIISNAIDACREEGTAIRVGITLHEPDSIIIEVADDGCGMDKSESDAVFDMFHSTKGPAGTGLGLTVSRKIVHEHRGRIDLQSQCGEGTTFRIHLPATNDSIISEEEQRHRTRGFQVC